MRKSDLDTLVKDIVKAIQDLEQFVADYKGRLLERLINNTAWTVNFKAPENCTVESCAFVSTFVNASGVNDDASSFASLYPKDLSNITL